MTQGVGPKFKPQYRGWGETLKTQKAKLSYSWRPAHAVKLHRIHWKDTHPIYAPVCTRGGANRIRQTQGLLSIILHLFSKNRKGKIPDINPECHFMIASSQMQTIIVKATYKLFAQSDHPPREILSSSLL
jgi:hypothetical protein